MTGVVVSKKRTEVFYRGEIVTLPTGRRAKLVRFSCGDPEWSVVRYLDAKGPSASFTIKTKFLSHEDPRFGSENDRGPRT